MCKLVFPGVFQLTDTQKKEKGYLIVLSFEKIHNVLLSILSNASYQEYLEPKVL
jgi:hypothetical protein